MNMKRLALLLCVAMACGGGKKGGDTTPTGSGEEGGGGGETEGGGGENSAMVSADTMEEITKMFQRKGNAVSRCLTMVVDNKELPKNSRGKVTLEVYISPAGKPERVKILKASLDNQALHNCIIERVKEIQFPSVPNTYPTTYTYAFESM
jgi:hypothetical protein